MSKSVNNSSYAKIVFKGTESLKKNNELIGVEDLENYDIKNILFSDVTVNKVPNTTISYKRVNIATRNNDKTYGDFLILTPRVFSFGVSENKSQDNPDKHAGYTLPLCLWSRDGPTEEEKSWIAGFERLCKHIESCVNAKPQDFGIPKGQTLTPKYNPLYQKKDEMTGDILDKTKGPTLYAKLWESKKTGSISTVFRDVNGNEIEPMTLLKKYCYVQCVLKIESLYIGSGKIILQIKTTEVGNVEPVESGPRSSFIKPTKTKLVMTSGGKNLNDTVENDEETKNVGSVENSEDEDDKPLAQMIVTQDSNKKTEVVKQVASVVEKAATKPKPVVRKVAKS